MQRKNNMPDIVYWGLLGINSKSAAYLYLSVSVLLGLAAIYFGLENPRYFWGCLMFLASLWYFYTINWVEKYSSWN